MTKENVKTTNENVKTTEKSKNETKKEEPKIQAVDLSKYQETIQCPLSDGSLTLLAGTSGAVLKDPRGRVIRNSKGKAVYDYVPDSKRESRILIFGTSNKRVNLKYLDLLKIEELVSEYKEYITHYKYIESLQDLKTMYDAGVPEPVILSSSESMKIPKEYVDLIVLGKEVDSIPLSEYQETKKGSLPNGYIYFSAGSKWELVSENDGSPILDEKGNKVFKHLPDATRMARVIIGTGKQTVHMSYTSVLEIVQHLNEHREFITHYAILEKLRSLKNLSTCVSKDVIYKSAEAMKIPKEYVEMVVYGDEDDD